MNQQIATTNPANGTGSAHELFALTDEQILEIAPEEPNTQEPNTQELRTADLLTSPDENADSARDSKIIHRGSAPPEAVGFTPDNKFNNSGSQSAHAPQAGGPVLRG